MRKGARANWAGPTLLTRIISLLLSEEAVAGTVNLISVGKIQPPSQLSHGTVQLRHV